jgi:hypothetical protein
MINQTVSNGRNTQTKSQIYNPDIMETTTDEVRGQSKRQTR